jgi:hypothetical protein
MRHLIFLLIIGSVLLGSLAANAQTVSTKAGDVLCWQPGQHLTVADFNRQHSDMMLRLHQEHGVQATATVAIFRVLDVPAKKHDRGQQLEQAYFVPGWLRSRSETFTADTAELARQQLFLDLAEVCCRRARKQVQALQDSLPRAYGTTYIFYPRIANECCQKYSELSQTYLMEALLEKKPGAYEKWRQQIRTQLAELEAFATTARDCERALTNRPVLPGYQLSATLFSALIPCK